MPDDADVCPSCGASRLELLVSPASEASLKPRRRHPVLKTLAVLLCVGVVAALAGQAYLSHDAASHAPPVKGKPKAKAPAKPAPTGTHASTPSDTPTQSTQSSAVLVYVGQVPADAPDADAPVAAVQAAMQAWGGAGVDLEPTDVRADADVQVRFVLDAADANSGGGVAEVPLGDRECAGDWHAYDQGSVQALAERALGQAMGRDGPSSLMDPSLQPHYTEPCGGTGGSLSVPSGRSASKAFHLAATTTVAYTLRSQPGYADVCLLTPDQWDAFANGEGGGYACHFASQDVSDQATLAPGDYLIGFRCSDTGYGCGIDYTLSAQG